MKTLHPIRLLPLLTLLLPVALAAQPAPSPPVPALSPAVGSGDHDGDGIDDGLEQMLAERYAPVIFIHPHESNYPVNVDWFLAHAHLEYFEDCFPDVDETDPAAPNPLGNQDALVGSPWAHPDDWGPGHPERHCGDAPDHRRITATEPDPESYSDQVTFVLPDLPDDVKLGSLNPGDWKSYVHVYPNDEGGVTVQFWHCFAYNGYDYVGFGNHGGDWDATIHIVLGPDLKPIRAIYSRHSEDHPGASFPWSEVHTYRGTHPLMIVDRGGHGAFKDVQDHDDNAPPGSDYTWFADPDQPGYGTVWKTWTGGEVRQDDQEPFPVTHHLSPNPGVTGGIVNLGEYNPGAHQASPLLAGEFLPLNGQTFLKYEGRWGSVGLIFSGPRGPVFQGYDGGVYKSWYQGASDAPAAVVTHPWKAAPTSTLILSGPVHDGAGVREVTTATAFTLSGSQNLIAEQNGDFRIFWRAYPTGQLPPRFEAYTSPVHLTGADGAYTFEHYAVDALGNVEDTQSASFVLDDSAPAVAVTAPAAGTYPHSATLILDYTVTDPGSGVSEVDPTLDGAALVAGHGLGSGQPIDLLTELTLGMHTFTVVASDNLDNRDTTSVQFDIVVTPESIEEDVNLLAAAGKIAPNQVSPLLRKLDQAKDAVDARGCRAGFGMYLGFANQVSSQSGKGIDSDAASVLVADAKYLMSCGGPEVPPGGTAASPPSSPPQWSWAPARGRRACATPSPPAAGLPSGCSTSPAAWWPSRGTRTRRPAPTTWRWTARFAGREPPFTSTGSPGRAKARPERWSSCDKPHRRGCLSGAGSTARKATSPKGRKESVCRHPTRVPAGAPSRSSRSSLSSSPPLLSPPGRRTPSPASAGSPTPCPPRGKA